MIGNEKYDSVIAHTEDLSDDKIDFDLDCIRPGLINHDAEGHVLMVPVPIASSQYWNSVHGGAKGDANEDLEGLQTMRTLARNMTFLMKSIELGKEKYGIPEKEAWQGTNFIR